MSKIAPIIKAIFKKKVDQNEKLLNNIKKWEEKQKKKRQKPIK